MFEYDWNWSAIWTYRFALLQGVGVSLALTSVAIVAGTIAGLAVGIAQEWLARSQPILAALLLFSLDAIKALPPLILMLLCYYWLPYVVGLRSPFWLAALALAVNLGAFVADLVRHAIAGVPRPLVEACFAVGMTRAKALRYVIVPEALRSIVPSLGYLYLSVLKLSSLASVIAVHELLYRASEISTHTFRFLEVYAALAIIYLVLLMPFSYIVRRLESSPLFLRRS
jgi:polar amino acid transport system permease protein